MKRIGKNGRVMAAAVICLLVLGGVPVRAQEPHSRHQGGPEYRSHAPVQVPEQTFNQAPHQAPAPRPHAPKPPEPVIIYRGQNPPPAPAPAPAPPKKSLLSILLPHLSIDLDL